MELDEIKALPVHEIATSDAVLYLWALPHMAPKAWEVMTAWSFAHRTEMVWVKDRPGLGQWTRNQHEILMIGRRGAFPPPPEALRSPSVIYAPVGKHSEKPAIFTELIERFYPGLSKVELFCRGQARPGWSAWGNEAEAPQ
jgi:N6-adenosine-specific RNA methylase IME4